MKMSLWSVIINRYLDKSALSSIETGLVWHHIIHCAMKVQLIIALVFLTVASVVNSFSVPKFRFSSIVQRKSSCFAPAPCRADNFKLAAIPVGSVMDISPDKDGSIMKTLLREGALGRSLPILGDTVEIVYKITDFFSGTLIHDSRNGPRTGIKVNGVYPVEGEDPRNVLVVRNVNSMTFKIGVRPRQVFKGMEIAAMTMRLGELSSYVMEPEMAFGERGLPGVVAPNTKLLFEFELVDIVPDWTLAYAEIGEDEGIKDYLAKDLESGSSPLTQNVYKKPKLQRSFGTNVGDFTGEVVPGKGSGATQSSPSAAATTAPVDPDTPRYHVNTPNIRVSEPPPMEQRTRPDGTPREFYDPERHVLDTTTVVGGQTPDGSYNWKESFTAMDIQIPLKIAEDARIAIRHSKKDILVAVK